MGARVSMSFPVIFVNGTGKPAMQSGFWRPAVRTDDLMKKGLRRQFCSVYGQPSVRTDDLMKKGLRRTKTSKNLPFSCSNR